MQLGFFEHLVLFQAPLDQRQRESRAVDRHVDLASKNGTAPMWSSWPCVRIRPRTCSRFCFEKREVGRDDIDAQQFGIGEHHPGIDDDDVVAVAEGHRVHAELAQSAQRDDLQLLI